MSEMLMKTQNLDQIFSIKIATTNIKHKFMIRVEKIKLFKKNSYFAKFSIFLIKPETL